SGGNSRTQLKWTQEALHAMLCEANNQEESLRLFGNKEEWFDSIAAALLQTPLFQEQARQGAVATGSKVRHQYNSFISKVRDEKKGAEFVSGVRSGEHGENILRAVEEAI
ncbi:unnamed protein product, partial [Ectocarpus sp. 12 AP-2014]